MLEVILGKLGEFVTSSFTKRGKRLRRHCAVGEASNKLNFKVE
jgi:hypothetical protein